MANTKKSAVKKPGAKAASARKAGVKTPTPRKRVATSEGGGQDILNTPLSTLTLQQLFDAGLLNENSKFPLKFPVQLSDADIARIADAVVTLQDQQER